MTENISIICFSLSPRFFVATMQFILSNHLETTVQKQDNANYGRENEAKSSKGQLFIDMQIACLIDCLEQLQNDF